MQNITDNTKITPNRLAAKISQIREDLCKSFPFIHRLSVVIYHADRDMLQTYIVDEDIPSHMNNYETCFSTCTSLVELKNLATERVINDISIFDKSNHKHSLIIKKAGYQASFTSPLLIDGQLLGFLFANSRDEDVLHGEVVKQCKLIATIVALLLHKDLYRVGVLKSTVKSMQVISDKRDPETGEHLSRMSSYSLLIARAIAAQYRLTDVEIDSIYLYAPLHDIGKLIIPDSILLKPGSLTTLEFNEMKKHSSLGADLAARLIALYNLTDIPYISILFNIIRSHHEKIDGTGYPDGLSGDGIAIEARIVAVADIFDALTSERPYKKAWSNKEAFQELQSLAGTKLDISCVNALCSNEKKIEEIQRMFANLHKCNTGKMAISPETMITN